MYYIYLNELEPREPEIISYLEGDLNKSFPLFQRYKNLLIVRYIDHYEVEFAIKTDFSVKEFCKKMKYFDFYNKFQNNEFSKESTRERKFLINQNEEEEILGIVKNEKIKVLYGRLFVSKKFIKKVLKTLPIDKIAIIEDISEEYNFLKNRNIFLKKEIEYYLQIIDVYVGLFFRLIKFYLEEILNFIEILGLDKITDKNIEIRNKIQKNFKRKIRVNKKFHILNISSIPIIKKIQIYTANNGKFYLKVLENINKKITKNTYLNIKDFLPLNRKNIFIIKKNYNRNNEILLIYESPDKNEYIIKVTKSTNNRKYIPYSLEEYLKKKVLNEENKDDKI